MLFDEYEREARTTLLLPEGLSGEQRKHLLAFGLAAQIGDVARELKKGLRDQGDYQRLANELEVSLGHVMWYVSSLAGEFGLSLERIATTNLSYNSNRWRSSDPQQELSRLDFDEHFPSSQAFPRKFWARFDDAEVSGIRKTTIWVYSRDPESERGIQFGDPIDDNSIRDDNYRYHDVFHFAYAAILGWSPVIRKLLGIKRKEDGKVDRTQDGARARDLEEAITAFVYKISEAHRFYKTAQAVDTSVLDIIMVLAADLEVSARSRSDWEEAIHQACRAHSLLVARGGGMIEVDLDNRKISYAERGSR